MRQLAYVRLHGRVAPTYESCSTKAFFHGRTEVLVFVVFWLGGEFICYPSYPYLERDLVLPPNIDNPPSGPL